MDSVLIRNGLVYNGEDRPPVKADVLIWGDRIVRIGEIPEGAEAGRVIDASGLAVTPGFVDMHRHCDKGPMERKEGRPWKGRALSGEGIPGEHGGPDYGEALLRQGITTAVTGHCGISMVPVSGDANVREQMCSYYESVLGDIRGYAHIRDYSRYLEELRSCPLPVNTAAMIGMGAVRIAVKGFSPEPFTGQELEKCRRIVRDSLERGAPGVSLGLMYLPECYGTAEELGEILKPLGELDRILCTHIRGEGDSLARSVEEVVEIAGRAGCRLEISHFKSCGMRNWGRGIEEAIDLIEHAKSSGQIVDCDFYPYDCGSTTLMSLIPPEFVGGDIPGALRSLEGEAGRQRLRLLLAREYDDWDNYVISLGWDKAVISALSRPENQWTIGKNVAEIALEGGFADEVEVVSQLLCSEGGSVAMIIRSMDQKDVDRVARLPYSCVISDAIYADTDRPHPRMYGAFPRMIREYVKQRGVMRLEEAVAKMTGIPAGRMRLEGRGLLKEGYHADVNLFDPDAFRDEASYTEPVRLATGLKACLVNGKVAVWEDRMTGEAAGRLLSL